MSSARLMASSVWVSGRPLGWCAPRCGGCSDALPRGCAGCGCASRCIQCCVPSLQLPDAAVARAARATPACQAAPSSRASSTLPPHAFPCAVAGIKWFPLGRDYLGPGVFVLKGIPDNPTPLTLPGVPINLSLANWCAEGSFATLLEMPWWAVGGSTGPTAAMLLPPAPMLLVLQVWFGGFLGRL